MFVSAGVDLKFHDVFNDGDNDLEFYTPATISRIKHVSWCNDNNYIVILSENGNPEIISLRTRHTVKLVHIVQALEQVTSVTFQRTTKKCIGLATAKGQVALYDTRNRAISKLFANLNSKVIGLDFNFDDMFLAAATENGTTSLFALMEGEIIETFKLPNKSEPTMIKFHPEMKKYLTAATVNGEVVVWDVNSANTIFASPSHTSRVTGVALSSSRGILVSVGRDSKLCVYDFNTHECMFRNNFWQPLTSVDINGDGNSLVVGSDEGYVYVYDMRKLIQPLRTMRPHNSSVNKVVFANHVNGNEDASMTSVLSGFDECDRSYSGQSLCDAARFERMKDEVLGALERHVEDLSMKMADHFNKFKSYMDHEFAAIDSAIRLKGNLLSVVESSCNAVKKEDTLQD